MYTALRRLATDDGITFLLLILLFIAGFIALFLAPLLILELSQRLP